MEIDQIFIQYNSDTDSEEDKEDLPTEKTEVTEQLSCKPTETQLAPLSPNNYEILVPISLHVNLDGLELRDAFTWNLRGFF